MSLPEGPAAGDERQDPQAPSAPANGQRRAPLLHFLRTLGPGLITGAADDDPSGISTYSQAGAAYGFGFLWTALITLPLMAAVQLMCARVGTVTRTGLASVLRTHYARWVLWVACVLLLVANTVNIAADLGGMAAATRLLIGIPEPVSVPLFALLILLLLVFASYSMMVKVLKWLALTLFAYVGAAWLAHPDWWAVVKDTVWPHLPLTQDALLTVVALLGTTISPYLFFWQASQNAEAEVHLQHQIASRQPRAMERELRAVRTDVNTGMTFSNGIMFVVVLTAGATLHRAGITHVDTAQQAAEALRPLAGNEAFILFAAGIIATGLLGVPVLAGSAAYALAEAFDWPRGMDCRVPQAPQFYGVITLATLVGVVIASLGVNAIRLLFWSAVINGLLAPPLIVIILIVCNNAQIMGCYRNKGALNVLGWAAAAGMGIAAVGLVASWF